MTSMITPMDHIKGLHRKVDGLPERFREEAAAREYEVLRTRKFMRFQMTGPGANPFSMGGDAATQERIGPELGYIWSIGLLCIEGLTTGASQDTVQIFRAAGGSQGQGRLLWQLTGNQPCATIGKGEIILFSGDILQVSSLGTFGAVGASITLSGVARQVAAERAGEVF